MKSALKRRSIATAIAGLLVASMTGALAKRPPTLTIHRARLMLAQRLRLSRRQGRAWRPRRAEAWRA